MGTSSRVMVPSLVGTQRPPSTPGKGEPVSSVTGESSVAASPVPPSSPAAPLSEPRVIPESVWVVDTGPHLPSDSHTPDAQSAPTEHWGEELEHPHGATPAKTAKQSRQQAGRRSMVSSHGDGARGRARGLPSLPQPEGRDQQEQV